MDGVYIHDFPFPLSNHQTSPSATEVTFLLASRLPTALQEVDRALGRAHHREGLRIAGREGT